MYYWNCSLSEYQNAWGPPPPPPQHYAIDNIHRDILLLGILHYNMSFETIAGGFNMVFSDGMVHFLKIEKIFNKSTNTILWL